MAVSLKGEDFGRLVDFFGGLRDLEGGVVRTLHNLSFIDDPTRIFRAIRYENRYGFRMDSHTAALARACVEMNLVGDSRRRGFGTSPAPSPRRSTGRSARLSELGVAQAIHPHLAADDEAIDLVGRTDELGSATPPRSPWRAPGRSRAASPGELFDWFERLKIRRRDAERIADAVTVAPRLAGLVAEAESAAEPGRVVQPHDPDGALLLALADEPARGRLVRYFEELREVRLEIDGGDLAGLGVTESPRVGEILDELLRRKLDGELDGRAAELDAARALVASR